MSHRGNPARSQRAGGPSDREEPRFQEKSARGKKDQPEGDDEWIAKDEDWSDHIEQPRTRRKPEPRHPRQQEPTETRLSRNEPPRRENRSQRNTTEQPEPRGQSEHRKKPSRGQPDSHYRGDKERAYRQDERENYADREKSKRDYKELTDDKHRYPEERIRPSRASGYDYHAEDARPTESRENGNHRPSRDERDHEPAQKTHRESRNSYNYDSDRKSEQRRSLEQKPSQRQRAASAKKMKGSDVDNYRFNNEPNVDKPKTSYEQEKEFEVRAGQRTKEDRFRRDRDENNYKFTKTTQKNDYNHRPIKKVVIQDNDEWMDDDSQDDDHDNYQPSRRGNRSDDQELPSKELDGRKKGFNKASKLGSMQKGWQKNVDNYGYIERKHYNKNDEGKPAGTIFRGQQYFVRVDDAAKPAPKPAANLKGKKDKNRDESPEYIAKQ